MPIFQSQKNNSSFQLPKKLDYNLEEEKKIVAEGIAKFKKDLLEQWKKENAGAQIFPVKSASLNLELRNFLLSFENTIFYNNLAKEFNLTQEQRDEIPHIIWQTCIQKSFSELEKNLQILNISPSLVTSLANSLDQKIFSQAQSFSNKNFVSPTNQQPNKKIFNAPIDEVLKKIPEIGEQQITSEKIMLGKFPDPIRPSVKNWLADYFSNIGNEKHDSMQRGIYLFQSLNGKKLNSEDRHRLDYLLKAVDDNSLLDIDETAKKIIFPKFEQAPQPKANPSQIVKPSADNSVFKPKENRINPTSNIQSARFSSTQRLPFEKQSSPQPKPTIINKPTQSRIQAASQSFFKPQQNSQPNSFQKPQESPSFAQSFPSSFTQKTNSNTPQSNNNIDLKNTQPNNKSNSEMPNSYQPYRITPIGRKSESSSDSISKLVNVINLKDIT